MCAAWWRALSPCRVGRSPLLPAAEPADDGGDGRYGGVAVELQRIVVGFDGSENSERALEVAAGMLAPGGMVHVVTASDPAERQRMQRVLDMVPDEFRNGLDLDTVAEEHLLAAAELLRDAGVGHVTHLADGDAAEAVLEVADEVDADLVVVGSRGLRRGTRFLRGSVSSKVASHARCSFLVVHDDMRETVDA